MCRYAAVSAPLLTHSLRIFAEKFMYSTLTHKEDISRCFFEFNRLPLGRKLAILQDIGVLLDTDVDKERVVKLYFLYGFFVERIESLTGEHLELIPYKNGYRVYNFLN